MANKAGQEKRKGLSLNLNEGSLAASGLTGGFNLDTPVLDKACELALPTPVLNKKVLEMYAVKSESAPVSSQITTATTSFAAPQAIVVTNSSSSTTQPTVAVKPYQPLQQPQQSYPVVIVCQPPGNRDGSQISSQVSHPRIGQSASATSVVVPASMSLQPLDPVEQERLKVDRKRERNRAAAQRCREKKIRRIDDLSEEVEELERERSRCVNSLRSLETQAGQTLQAVQEHKAAGCDLENGVVNKLVTEATELRRIINNHLSTYGMPRVQENFQPSAASSMA